MDRDIEGGEWVNSPKDTMKPMCIAIKDLIMSKGESCYINHKPIVETEAFHTGLLVIKKSAKIQKKWEMWVCV